MHIQLGQKYILQFDNQNIYNNFVIVTHNNFNNNIDLPYFTYDDLNKTIHILLTDNNYPKQLYYHYRNSLSEWKNCFLVYTILIKIY